MLSEVLGLPQKPAWLFVLLPSISTWVPAVKALCALVSSECQVAQNTLLLFCQL